MRQIDELHLQHPTMGSRMLRDQLNRMGFEVGRRHVSTLMRKMGIGPFCVQRITSLKHPKHRIYPYLLRAMKIDRANQVWALDTTYIPMAKGFVDLVHQSGAQISMDGKVSWRDNVFIERFWKTLKCNHVYLHAYESVSDAREKILRFLNWYNTQRPHSSLDGMTPDEAYFKTLTPTLKAA